jgi:hypothetical protein
MTDTSEVTVSVTVDWWYAGTVATIAAILNDHVAAEGAQQEQEEIEKFLNRFLDICHPVYYIRAAAMMERYATMFRAAHAHQGHEQEREATP